jgi:hypothetical protein
MHCGIRAATVRKAMPVVFGPRTLRDQGNVQHGSRGIVQPK